MKFSSKLPESEGFYWAIWKGPGDSDPYLMKFFSPSWCYNFGWDGDVIYLNPPDYLWGDRIEVPEVEEELRGKELRAAVYSEAGEIPNMEPRSDGGIVMVASTPDQTGHHPDWCPYTRSNVHTFTDRSEWNGENHPACACGYIDRSRPAHDQAEER